MAFFSARQPILTTDKKVFGYELLFRSGTDNVFPDVNEETATSKMIEGLQFDLGLDKISSGRQAFINFTESSILKAYPNMLPKHKVVVEVLETVRPTKAVYAQLEALAAEGYKIALDDFVHSPQWEPFYKLCAIIKIDIQFISEEQLNAILDVKKRFPQITLLAEKVETYDEFNRYAALGFELFQGYFFSKPEVIERVSLSASQSILSSLLSEITKPDLDIKRITQLFEIDVALSFKLLRYTQSPLFQRRRKIDNIKQAIVLLGQKELKRFVMLLFAAVFGDGKPTELLKLSIHRAKFCERYAEQADLPEELSSAFLVGMLSLIDAMLDSQIDELITNMPLSDSIKQALLQNTGKLAEFVALCKHIEQGNWQDIDQSTQANQIGIDDTLALYKESGEWAEQQLQVMS